MEPETIIDSTSPTPLMRDRELLRGAVPHHYKSIRATKLTGYFFYPDDHKDMDRRTVVVFFHSGLWDKQMVSQFAPQALHFTSRGAITVLAEYRVSSVHYTTPEESISDAQSLILWLRENHEFLGIDPHKVIACGAGSGAHIALCAAMHQEVENDGLYDGRPDALILYSAIIDTGKNGVGYELFKDKKYAVKSSPIKNIRKNLPPSIFYHGAADQTTPIEQVEKFCKKLRAKKNTCLFCPFPRGTHSFFNFNVNQQNFIQSLDSADGFLCDQGFLVQDGSSYMV